MSLWELPRIFWCSLTRDTSTHPCLMLIKDGDRDFVVDNEDISTHWSLLCLWQCMFHQSSKDSTSAVSSPTYKKMAFAYLYPSDSGEQWVGNTEEFRYFICLCPFLKSLICKTNHGTNLISRGVTDLLDSFVSSFRLH